MLKVMSLYDTNPQAWAGIAAESPACAEMARHFTKTRDMDAALNYSGGAVGHWVSGRSRVSRVSERRAREWLDARIAPKANGTHTHVTTASQATQSLFDLAPPPAPSGSMLLVVAPDPAKVTKVLQLLGCEVTEI
jgi:hypothetical protein